MKMICLFKAGTAFLSYFLFSCIMHVQQLSSVAEMSMYWSAFGPDPTENINIYII